MWFTENPWPPIVISALIALVFLGMWNSNRRGLHLVIALGFIGLCFVLYPLERSIITEGERVQLRVEQLCYDFRDKKDIRGYVSDTREDLKTLFEEAGQLITIQSDLRLSDFSTRLLNEGQRATVHFRANATVRIRDAGDVGYQPARLILTLEREKGEWKIIEVERLNPINGKRMGTLEQSAG